MLKNILKIAVRNLLKHKGFSLINILGLSVGMACCILLIQFIIYEHSYDKFHKNHENLYRLQYNSFSGDIKQFECAASVAAVGPAMKENFPEVIEYVKFMDFSTVVTYKDRIFREHKVQFATPSVFSMFTFPLIHGDAKSALVKPNTIVFSESYAKKYFGNEDPIGKKVDLADYGEFEVTGVFKDVPNNSHIKFNIMISFQTLIEMTKGSAHESWNWYDFNTYIQLDENTNTSDFHDKFHMWLNEKNKEFNEKYNKRQEFILQPITSIHLNSNILEEAEPEENGDAASVKFLLIIAIFILVIAWINYINLSTSRSLGRAKEVGIRKVVGALRKQLVKQFIFESMIINFIAIILSIIIAEISLPIFYKISGTTMSMVLFKDPIFWISIISAFTTGALISSIYPAFILSSFKPVKVLKGTFSKSSSSALLRQILVVIQFTASIVLIIGTIIVFKQMLFLNNKDLGFEMDKTLVLWGATAEDSLFSNTLKSFKNEVLENHLVESFTTSSNIPGDVLLWSTSVHQTVADTDKSRIFYFVGMDADYVPSYQIDMIAGRNFSDKLNNEDQKIILNEHGLEALEFESPESAIGKSVTCYGENFEIIGVIDSYNQMSLKSVPIPLGYFFDVGENAKFYSIKLKDSNYSIILPQLKTIWNNYFPNEPFDYFFLDNFYNKQYTDEKQFLSVFGVFSILAILVACLGLYGLSAFSTQQRFKEIGIRKVLGSSVSNITYILNKDFMTLILISNLIAFPIAYFIMKKWLENFAYRIHIDILVFIISSVLVGLIAFLTVSIQTIKTANTNPVKALKYE